MFCNVHVSLSDSGIIIQWFNPKLHEPNPISSWASLVQNSGTEILNEGKVMASHMHDFTIMRLF